MSFQPGEEVICLFNKQYRDSVSDHSEVLEVNKIYIVEYSAGFAVRIKNIPRTFKPASIKSSKEIHNKNFNNKIDELLSD